MVEGRIGYLSGFTAHAGRIIALGGADDACADSLRGGDVRLAALGIDARFVEPAAEEVAAVEVLLAARSLGDSSRAWRKIISAPRLWHFRGRDAKVWLMI